MLRPGLPARRNVSCAPALLGSFIFFPLLQKPAVLWGWGFVLASYGSLARHKTPTLDYVAMVSEPSIRFVMFYVCFAWLFNQCFGSVWHWSGQILALHAIDLEFICDLWLYFSKGPHALPCSALQSIRISIKIHNVLSTLLRRPLHLGNFFLAAQCLSTQYLLNFSNNGLCRIFQLIFRLIC